MQIPIQGQSKDQVLQALRKLRKTDPDWSEGKIFGYIFHGSDDVAQAIEEAFRIYMWDNALDPSTFPSLLKLETEVVAMAAAHLHGGPDVVGNFTSGGTESCMLAVKTARDWARANKPNIKEPEMILPVTAHPAFHKGAHYLDVKAVTVPVDPQTLKADMNAVRAAINDNTILIVGSASNFAFGVVDPIPEMAALAQERGILMHTDGCIGGFILEWFEKLGHKVTPFDFRVKGVTSISMDLHKYAFAAKGASVVLYTDKTLRKHQIFAHSGWTGYTIINPTIQSTKSGGPLAGAWAVLHYLGQEGYLKIAQELKAAFDKFATGIAAIPELYIMGQPEAPLAAVGAKGLNIFELCDEMRERGWHLGPIPGTMGVPSCFHITMLPFNTGKVEAMLADLRDCVAIVKAKPQSPQVAQFKAMLANLNVATLNDAAIDNVLKMVGIGGGNVPNRMAEINTLLESMPADLADRLLTAFYNEWSRYRA